MARNLGRRRGLTMVTFGNFSSGVPDTTEVNRDRYILCCGFRWWFHGDDTKVTSYMGLRGSYLDDGDA
ncbi:hypothetical protein Hdeb2414_s0013g00414311 [Helianthus debilis subsp. tardiflorus]